MISGLSYGFVGRGSRRLLDRKALVLTVAAPLYLARLWHEPQPTTVSHGADGPGARMSRCTPTGLHHVAGAIDQSKPRRPARADGA